MTKAFAKALFLLLILGAALVRAEVPAPPLKARVTDLTGTLSAQQAAQLEQRLQAFEAKKGSQIAVLIVPTTKPEEIEQYSIRVAEQWKLGRKAVDDGVLLLIAKEDKKLRIEVGRGLEGAIPDAIAKRIISEIIVPQFKQGNFFAGIEVGVERIIGVIEGEPLPAPTSRSGVSKASFDQFETAFVIAVFGLIAGSFLAALIGRFIAGAVTGSAAGLIAGLLLSSLIFGVVVGVIVFLFALMGKFTPHYSGGGGGGWSSGGGGFSSSGGGFSGGGGSFGGGGASGSW